MRRLIACLLILAFSLPFITAGSAHASSSAPSLAMHALLHEHEVDHHHRGQSHLFQLGDSDESDRHLTETIPASHCTILLPSYFDLQALAVRAGQFEVTSATIPPDPDPDRLYRPPQA